MQAGAQAGANRDAARQTLQARADRQDSRTRYRGLDGRGARDLAAKVFPDAIAQPAFAATRVLGGRSVRRYLSDTSAVVEEGNGQQGVVQSSVPLRTDDGGSGQRPVDLGLARHGSVIEPRAPLGRLRIGTALADGITLPTEGVQLRLANAPNSDAQLAGDHAFWSNVATDTDLSATPIPYGVETFLQLRSQDSPEQYAFDVQLPNGASLRDVNLDQGSPQAGSSQGIEIVRDGVSLALIFPPHATDADGVPVPVAMRSEGSNRIVLTVSHRSQDLKYPLLVDPSVIERFGASDYNWSDHGWVPNAKPGINAVLQSGCCTPAGSGLYLRFTHGVNYASGDWIQWQWTAPPNVYVYRTEFGFVTHSPIATQLAEGLFGGPQYFNWSPTSRSTRPPTRGPT